MKVRSLFRQHILTAGPFEDLAEVASRMQYHEVGALAVFEHGTLHGIITERDLVRAVADGVELSRTPVVRYMTADPVTISPDAEVSEAAEAMIRLGARHLPVIEGGEVVGMVSARDLLADEAGTREGANR